jgi:hypothetical protein
MTIVVDDNQLLQYGVALFLIQINCSRMLVQVEFGVQQSRLSVPIDGATATGGTQIKIQGTNIYFQQ